jgi:hypothetical protein
MNDYKTINPGDYVVTNKGNHGKVVIVGSETAKVKIGFRTYEIELINLFNVNKGTLLLVDYKHDINTNLRASVFIKHGVSLYSNGLDNLYKIVEDLLNKQLKQTVEIINILIP